MTVNTVQAYKHCAGKNCSVKACMVCKVQKCNSIHTPDAIGINVELVLSKTSLHRRHRTSVIQCTQVVVMRGKVISTTLANSYRLHHISISNFLSAAGNHTPCILLDIFFSNRVIKRWNQLDQGALEATSINAFKSKLDRLKYIRMGFFMDQSA